MVTGQLPACDLKQRLICLVLKKIAKVLLLYLNWVIIDLFSFAVTDTVRTSLIPSLGFAVVCQVKYTFNIELPLFV